MSWRVIMTAALGPFLFGIVLIVAGLGIAPTSWRDVQQIRYDLTRSEHELFVIGLYVLVPLGVIVIAATVWTITSHIVSRALSDNSRDRSA